MEFQQNENENNVAIWSSTLIVHENNADGTSSQIDTIVRNQQPNDHENENRHHHDHSHNFQPENRRPLQSYNRENENRYYLGNDF